MGEIAARDVYRLAMTDAVCFERLLMLDTTRTAAAAIFAADPTMTDDERKARLAPDFTPTNPAPLDPIISPMETGKLFGKDRHTLANWEKRGLLRAVRTGKDGRRITGYTGESVRALLSGNPLVSGKAVA